MFYDELLSWVLFYTALFDADRAVPNEITAVSFARLTDGDGVYAAVARDDDDRMVGFVHWTTHASTWNPAGYCYLEDLFVSSQARGAGVGQAGIPVEYTVELASVLVSFSRRLRRGLDPRSTHRRRWHDRRDSPLSELPPSGESSSTIVEVSFRHREGQHVL